MEKLYLPATKVYRHEFRRAANGLAHLLQRSIIRHLDPGIIDDVVIALRECCGYRGVEVIPGDTARGGEVVSVSAGSDTFCALSSVLQDAARRMSRYRFVLSRTWQTGQVWFCLLASMLVCMIGCGK